MSERGFTLVELMITLVISAIVIAAVYSAYKVQRDTYEAQDQITEMQQNIRAVLWTMIPEARMAGYDPLEKDKAKIMVKPSSATDPYYTKINRMSFSQDLNGDGDVNDPNEKIAYGFSDTDDPDFDGVIAVSDVAPLGRNVGGGFQPIAENISAIEFRYVLEDGTRKTTITSYEAEHQLNAVEITILARARQEDRRFTNSQTYQRPSGLTWGPYNDHYRRLLLTTTVQIRNLGI